MIFLTPYIHFLCSVPFQDIVIKGEQSLPGPKRSHGHVMGESLIPTQAFACSPVPEESEFPWESVAWNLRVCVGVDFQAKETLGRSGL